MWCQKINVVFWALVLFFSLDSILVAGQNLPIAETKQGLVEGTYDGVSRDGRQFYQFRGIQYAVIAERFSPSVEPSAWNGTKPAKNYGPRCDDIANHGEEDCLFLNVFTTSLGSENSTLKPVAIYIHGGSFQVGAADDHGPNYIMDFDMVYVTINYRLAALGFLSTGDATIPGNYGLKDQVMALKWIQDSIAGFGGDKTKVTLFGQSAGGASVSYHLISPMSQGLFRNAFVQSGTFLDPWAFTRKPQRYARSFAKVHNCSDVENSTAILECLRAIPVTVIADRQFIREATITFFEEPFSAFGPVMEPLIEDGSNTFLSQSPYEILVSGNFSKVPIMSGVAKEEGIYIWAAYVLFGSGDYAADERKRLEANWTGIAPAAFYFDEKAPSDKLKELGDKVREYYFGPEFSLDDNATFLQLSHLYSDRLFVASAIRFMNLYARHAPTYPYIYTFNKFVGLEFGWEEIHKNYSLDATHAAELDMIQSPLFDKVRVDADHDAVSKNVLGLWASFMKDSVPTATYGSELNFPPIDPQVGLQKWYKLDMDTELMDDIFAEGTKFWESLNLSDDDFINCYC